MQTSKTDCITIGIGIMIRSMAAILRLTRLGLAAGIPTLYGYVTDPNAMVDFFGLRRADHPDILGKDNSNSLYHYTDASGAEAIQNSGVIKPDNRGRVFVTTDQIPADDVNNALFMGQKPGGGSHVVEIDLADPNDYKLTTRGTTQPNELIYEGAIRNGKNANITVGRNKFE